MSGVDTAVQDARKVAERIGRRLTSVGLVVAAGGTGGHLVPALAVAQAWAARGRPVLVFTDSRGAQIPLPADTIKRVVIEGSALTGGVDRKLITAVKLARALGRAHGVLDRADPAAVAAFGGYPVLPLLTAARLRGLPIVLHEQNAVLGRVNRLFAGQADALALSYEQTARLTKTRARLVLTGNPCRQAVHDAATQAYSPPSAPEGPVRLLVVGGSQGARILSDVVPDAVALLPPGVRRRLRIVQQCRPEDLERVRRRYHDAEVTPKLSSFMTDLPRHMAEAHLVIGRAGGSTISELLLIGRPAILVPLAIATDDHQAANAAPLVKAGAAWSLTETRFTPQELAKLLQKLIASPDMLARAAAAAKALATPRARDAIVDLIEEMLPASARRALKREDAA
ncbi:MAG: undecaprenyldiphospho-muramoylpentapeptide beta-N-acetylglucosaminyltransferase [Rhodothalassiaceae bacterium]